MRRYKSLSAIGLTLLFLAACSSSNGGGIFGGPSSTPNNATYEIRGTVDSVDSSGRSVYLTNVSGYNSMLSSGGNNAVRVFYDDRTTVDWQGRSYRPENLERGDQISVRVDETNNRLLADSMTVTYNAGGSGTSSSYPSSSYPTTDASTVRGTVRSIDTGRRTIEVDRGYGSTVTLEYDTATPVYWGNQTYRAADLERGDEIDVRVRDYGSGRLVAQDITVTRNVSSGGTSSGSSSSSLSTVRGTVRYIDSSRRTIELGSTNWISGFNRNGGSNAGTIVVQYDTNTSVDASGRLYPVQNLEVGDVVEVQMQNMGGSTYRADRIVLVRDVNAR